jgi:hypothetical protein
MTVEERLARVEERMKDIGEMRRDIRDIRDMLAQAKGGWKTMLMIAGLVSALASAMTWLLAR